MHGFDLHKFRFSFLGLGFDLGFAGFALGLRVGVSHKWRPQGPRNVFSIGAGHSGGLYGGHVET